ncbi:MAG TPA: hypothetical protein VF025_00235 [Gaiellaceae bacterium]
MRRSAGAGRRRTSYGTKGEFALSEHGLMMPAMLIPMFLRLDLYTGRARHAGHHTGDGGKH